MHKVRAVSVDDCSARRLGRTVVLFAVATFSACSGGPDSPPTAAPPIGNPSNPSTPAVAAVVNVSGEAPSLVLGRTLQLTAVVRDTKGAVMPGRSFTWTSSSRAARISTTGFVTSIAAGSVVFTARDESSGITGALTMTVATPPRPPGALMRFGVDSMFDFGAWVQISALIAEDSARAGTSQRIAIVQQAGASIESSISRAQFPLMYSISECRDGSAYATSYSTTPGGSVAQLWQISLATGVVTPVMSLSNFIPFGSFATLACDSPTRLFMANNFGGLGEIFIVNAVTQARSSLGIAVNGDSYLGIAYTPTTGLLATTQNRNTTASPFPQLLVSINTATGTRTPVGANQVRDANLTTNLWFSGNRLLGMSSGRLVEINTQTGAVSIIR